ncbi:MAG: hypothetical protein JWP40_4551 [Blastococcus sp.]|jgi:hypothetical protein|nr:hypothetical protein [Blastococcus sp.]
MTSSTRPQVRTARRFALTLAVAGIAALGSVAIAPAASAAPVNDGPAYIIEGPGNGNGPDKFIVTDSGRIPVFFCDAAKPTQHHNDCITLSPTGQRF